MQKVKRTKIIIEETSGQTNSTKVFVNGEKYEEINFSDEAKKKSTSKEENKKKNSKSTSSSKVKKTNASSSVAKAKKATSKSKSKSTTTKKKTSTSKKKKSSTASKKEVEKKESVKEESAIKETSKEVIELPLLNEEKKEESKENKEENNIKEEKELASAEILGKNKEKSNSSTLPVISQNNIPSILESEQNNKEVIDNPEIIDSEIKTENEVKAKDNKPETLNAEIIEKEEKDVAQKEVNEDLKEETTSREKDVSKEESKTLETKEKNKKEETNQKEDNKDTSKVDNKKNETKQDKQEEKPEGTKEKSSSILDSEIENKSEENKEEQIEKTNKEKETKYIYVPDSDDEENKKEETTKNKLKKLFFSTKGLIIGGVILAVLIAILVPVSMNLSTEEKQNENLIKINQNDISKENFISERNFFDNLTSLNLTFADRRSRTSTLFLELNYSYQNDIYYFELTSRVFYTEEEITETTVDKIEQGENSNYLFTTKVDGDTLNVKDEEETLTKVQAKDRLEDIITSFYNNYCSYNATSVNAVIDGVKNEENNPLTYYFNKSNEKYLIKNENGTLVVNFNELGLFETVDYANGGICPPGIYCEPTVKLYELNIEYNF